MREEERTEDRWTDRRSVYNKPILSSKKALKSKFRENPAAREKTWKEAGLKVFEADFPCHIFFY